MIENNNKKWFALYTKPRHEFKAALQLESEEISYYLPVITRLKQWSDRKKKITEPLLRGYIFIFADEKERYLSLQQLSIVRCIFDHGRPAVIPEWQIDNLKKFLNKETNIIVNSGIVLGAKVKILDGPFAGVIGVINQELKGKTIAINIDLLNRTILAKISKETGFEIIKD
ncbi:MAG: UpxY family transcription antiterminator [Bacteroidetes bacterium]|nr:UpxY family transcription antiterminator [Bacteroidota bacterium]